MGVLVLNKSQIMIKYLKQKSSRLFLRSLSYAFFALALIVPKNKKVVVFIPRFKEAFEGNVKYCYLYFAQAIKNNRNLKVFYLSRKKSVYKSLIKEGLPAVFFPSLKCLIVLLRTHFVFLDSNDWWSNPLSLMTSASNKIQLWHGSGIKSIALLRKKNLHTPSIKKEKKLLWKSHRHPVYEYVIFGSHNQYKTRKNAFRFKEHLIVGNPRNDIIFGNTYKGYHIGCDVNILKKLESCKTKNTKAIIVAPTHKSTGHKSMTDFIDFKRLGRFAKQNNLIIIVKLHPKDKSSISETDNIMVYEKSKDVYPVFQHTSCLVTDYSSIYTDYIIGAKKVIFFPYDYDEYVKDRGVLYNYNQVTPGPKCYNQDELENALFEMLVSQNDPWLEKRITTASYFFKDKDGYASQRLFNMFYTKHFT